MEPQIQQLTQRVELLKKHVQEWRNTNTLNAQLQKQLLDQHRQEKEEQRYISNPIKSVELITRQAEELTALALKCSLYLDSLRSRQWQEYMALEKQLEQASDSSS